MPQHPLWVCKECRWRAVVSHAQRPQTWLGHYSQTHLHPVLNWLLLLFLFHLAVACCGPSVLPYPLTNRTVLDGELIPVRSAVGQQVFQPRQLSLQHSVLLLKGHAREHGSGRWETGTRIRQTKKGQNIYLIWLESRLRQLTAFTEVFGDNLSHPCWQTCRGGIRWRAPDRQPLLFRQNTLLQPLMYKTQDIRCFTFGTKWQSKIRESLYIQSMTTTNLKMMMRCLNSATRPQQLHQVRNGQYCPPTHTSDWTLLNVS